MIPMAQRSLSQGSWDNQASPRGWAPWIERRCPDQTQQTPSSSKWSSVGLGCYARQQDLPARAHCKNKTPLACLYLPATQSGFVLLQLLLLLQSTFTSTDFGLNRHCTQPDKPTQPFKNCAAWKICPLSHSLPPNLATLCSCVCGYLLLISLFWAAKSYRWGKESSHCITSCLYMQ